MFQFKSASLSGLFLLLGCATAGTPGARDATGGLSGANNMTTSDSAPANNGNVNTGGASAATGGTLVGGTTDVATGSVIIKADFQQRTPATYSESMVTGDFGKDGGWNNGLDQGRASIVDEDGNRFLRVTYVGGAYGPDDGGVQFKVPFGIAYDELYLAYRMLTSTSSKAAKCRGSWVERRPLAVCQTTADFQRAACGVRAAQRFSMFTIPRK